MDRCHSGMKSPAALMPRNSDCAYVNSVRYASSAGSSEQATFSASSFRSKCTSISSGSFESKYSSILYACRTAQVQQSTKGNHEYSMPMLRTQGCEFKTLRLSQRGSTFGHHKKRFFTTAWQFAFSAKQYSSKHDIGEVKAEYIFSQSAFAAVTPAVPTHDRTCSLSSYTGCPLKFPMPIQNTASVPLASILPKCNVDSTHLPPHPHFLRRPPPHLPARSYSPTSLLSPSVLPNSANSCRQSNLQHYQRQPSK